MALFWLLLSNHIDPKLLTGGRGTVVDLGWSWFCTILKGNGRHISSGKPWEKPWEITVFLWENHGKMVIDMEHLHF